MGKEGFIMHESKSDDKNQNKQIPLKQKIMGAIGVPSDLISGGYIEIRGRGEVSICGCKRIVKYSEGEIILRIGKELLMIRGRGLTCSAYFSGNIGIGGYIDSLAFSGNRDYDILRKNGGNK